MISKVCDVLKILPLKSKSIDAQVDEHLLTPSFIAYLTCRKKGLYEDYYLALLTHKTQSNKKKDLEAMHNIHVHRYICMCTLSPYHHQDLNLCLQSTSSYFTQTA